MKVTLAQINTKLGDVQHNFDKIKAVIQENGENSDCIIFPEMSLPGYPLHDKIYDKSLLRLQLSKLQDLKKLLANFSHELTIVLGFVEFNEEKLGPDGRWLKYNAAAAITKKDIQTYRKKLLPNYDVFYDKRYYQEGEGSLHIPLKDKTATINICEDMRDNFYDSKPIQESLQLQKADLIINISSSPFSIGKLKMRFEKILSHTQEHHIPFVYVNQVGAQDGNINDGGSMVVDGDGEVIHLSPCFEENISTIDLSKKHPNITQHLMNANNNKYEQILGAMKMGIKDYSEKTNIKEVVIGVSGGIDSAVNLAILSLVLPKENIHAYYIPTKHSRSLGYVQELCSNLGIKFEIHDIHNSIETTMSEYQKIYSEEMDDITYQNIQARERGKVLNMYANKYRGFVVNNSNRTELAQGYATLYGDTIGFLSPLGDLIKTEVYELAHYLNQLSPQNIIPESVIERPASAELKDDQVDPFDYENESQIIDDIFAGEDIYELAQKYQMDIKKLEIYKKNNDRNEFKRVQSPRVFKLKSHSAGMGRVYPIVFG